MVCKVLHIVVSVNGLVTNDPKVIVSTFNDFFANVGSTIASQI